MQEQQLKQSGQERKANILQSKEKHNTNKSTEKEKS
jgi:hypothetical protein